METVVSEAGAGTSPIRVHELAQELNVTSRQVMDECESDPTVHNVTSALSTISADEANTIRDAFSTGGAGVSDSGEGNGTGEHGGAGGGRRRKRRRRRRGGGSENGGGAELTRPASTSAPIMSSESVSNEIPRGDAAIVTMEPMTGGSRKKPRRRRRGRSGGSESSSGQAGSSMNTNKNDNAGSQPSAPPPTAQASPPAANQGATSTPAKKPRRALYRAGRGSVSPAARERSGPDE